MWRVIEREGAARVTITRRIQNGQVVDYDYAWEGGRIVTAAGEVLNETAVMRPIHVPEHTLVGALFQLGPWRVRCIGEDPQRDEFYLVRESAWAQGFVAGERVKRAFRMVYRRAILTAQVWGLATCDPDRPPSWRDLHFVQRRMRGRLWT